MSFNRLTPEDFVISVDAVTSPLWSAETSTLTQFFTSSVQEAGSSGDFYLNVYQTSSTLTLAEIQFAVAYGDKNGSGSAWYNSLVPGVSPTRSTYGQYRNLIIGDENTDFIFGTVSASNFWALSIDRNRYKEALLPGTMTLRLSGSGIGTLSLTDNSNASSTVLFNDAGRVFQLVSGAAGVVYTGSNSNGYSTSNGSYGWFLPDIGTILINPLATSESINLAPSQSNNSEGFNYRKIFTAISGGAFFTANNEENIAADYIFVRVKNSEFNYSENPSFISGSTGEVLFDNFINSPQTFPTTIGLYNDNNELLAVAKLSRPMLKDFTKEALVRVKLDF